MFPAKSTSPELVILSSKIKSSPALISPAFEERDVVRIGRGGGRIIRLPF
jgi:hypothetical protein